MKKDRTTELVTANEAAALFGILPGRIRQWKNRGRLNPVGYDRRFPLFDASDIHRILEQSAQAFKD